MITKRELIEMLERNMAPDDAPVDLGEWYGTEVKRTTESIMGVCALDVNGTLVVVLTTDRNAPF